VLQYKRPICWWFRESRGL